MVGSGLRCRSGTADDGCSDAIVEECDYLADNIHVPILSRVTDGFKKKVDGLSTRFRIGNVGVQASFPLYTSNPKRKRDDHEGPNFPVDAALGAVRRSAE